MAISDFSKFFLYKWRYVIGYVAIGLIIASLLVFAGLFVPGGLSNPEVLSVIESHQLNYGELSTVTILNLPYHALQDALLTLFGPSVFVVKLPSLILALLTAVGLIILLRKWFRPNIAVMASIIAISTSHFVFIAQQGTPEILYVFWPTALLLLGTLITRQKEHRTLWKVIFGVTVALSLYTPLSIYMVLAIGLTIMAHPHLRTVIRKLSPQRLVLSFGAFFVTLIPLIIAIFQDPSLIVKLLGIPSEWPNLAENIGIIFQQYFLFWAPATLSLITPIFGLGAFILIVSGIWRLIKTFATTQSYLIIIWFVCLTPVIIINPDIINVTFTLTVLLIASGLTSIISYWYRLFPKNPYARITGLIPIIILIAALISSGVIRYVYGYYYNPSAANLFSNDISLLPEDTTQLITNSEERPFYEAISGYKKDSFEVSDKPTSEKVVTTRNAKLNSKEYTLSKIITNNRIENADRFYIYTKI